MPPSVSRQTDRKIGVFFSHADTGRLDGLDFDRVMAFALELPGRRGGRGPWLR